VIALLQRVSEARVDVDGETVGTIDSGLLVLLGVERGDGEPQAVRLVERVLGYRVFADGDGRMNVSLGDRGGGLLVVPQFTLAADTRKGTRASFTPAAAPDDGERLYGRFLELAQDRHAPVAGGRFAADMRVHLVNDGPVTFWLQVPPS